MAEDQKSGSDGTGPEKKPNLTELYEKMSQVLRENMEKAGNITEETFEKGLKESREWASKMKEHYGEDITKVSDFIRRDWSEAVRYTSRQTRKNLDLDRIQVGILGVLSKLAQSAGNQLEQWANRLNERLTYQSGEIAGSGSLKCTHCQQVILLEKPAPIPPCPNCEGTSFKRGY